jgi:prefoldin alpha subunit
MVEENELRRRYIESQVIERQMSDIQKQLESLDEQINELRYILLSFDEFKDVKKGDEAFVPFHNGVFIKVKIIDPSEFAINVGSGAIIKKSFDDTKIMFENQMNEILEVRGKLEKSYLRISELAKKTESEVKELLKSYESEVN